MSTPDRAAFLAGMRKLLDLLEAHPGLPLPAIVGGTATWHIYNGQREVLAVEEMLAVPLTGGIDPENDTYYVLSGDLDGMPVQIRAWAGDVAERRVAGTRVVEDVEWVRLPALPEAREDETAGEDESARGNE